MLCNFVLVVFPLIGCLWVTKINFLFSHLLLPSGRHAHILSFDFFLKHETWFLSFLPLNIMHFS